MLNVFAHPLRSCIYRNHISRDSDALKSKINRVYNLQTRNYRKARQAGVNAKKYRMPKEIEGPEIIKFSSSSAMLHGATKVHGGLIKKLMKTLPINPTRFDIDETTLSNVAWRKGGRGKETRTMAKYWGVFPDITNDFIPRINLVVRFPSEHISYRGNHLTPTQTKDKPSLKFESKGRLWTILMVDPDAPFPEDSTAGHWAHWIIGNIPGGNIEEGETWIDYVPPAPPKQSKPHRYVFLLCQQADTIYYSGPKIDSNTAAGRSNFNTREFLKQHNLVPKGLTFFHAKWDESVPEVYKSLGIEEPELEKKEKPAPVQPKQYAHM